MDQINIAIVGHVDHGKSTIIGRLLADTGALPTDKLEQVQETCRRNAKPFEYAFLLDALKDEQAQGITIDVARVFFKTARRHYLIIDAPGHVEFLKNMVSGASRAEVALLVIDAAEGVQENSRRHGYLLSLLGISHILVLINKMDLIGYAYDRYQAVRDEFSHFLARLGIEPLGYIPVAGMPGDNIASRSPGMPWYQGPCLLEAIDSLPQQALPAELPLRLPVQDVYKFTAAGDNRRIVAGTVLSGRLRVGDEVLFYPSGKKSTIKSIEAFNQPMQAEATAGFATGFTLQEQIYVTRGEVATLASQPRPEVTTRLQANLFWLDKEPLSLKREYLLKLGTARIPVRLESISRQIDTSSLAELPAQDQIGRNQAAECVLKLQKPLVFETVTNHPLLSRFVLVDRYKIRGGGIITQALPDQHSQVREQVLLRNKNYRLRARKNFQ